MYKQASKEKLRFTTTKGSLATEQLWDLSLAELDALTVSLEIEHNNSGKKSFLTPKSAKDKTAKLRFDIVYDVLITKSEDAKAASEKLSDKAHNQKIMGIIQEKEEDALKGKSVKELKALIKN